MNNNSYILYLDNIVFVFMKKKSRVNKIYLWTQKSNKGFYLICTDKNKDDESQSLVLCTRKRCTTIYKRGKEKKRKDNPKRKIFVIHSRTKESWFMINDQYVK